MNDGRNRVLVAQTAEEKVHMLRFLAQREVFIPHGGDLQTFGGVRADVPELQGVVALNNFCGRTCCMHVAGDGRWLTPYLIWFVFDFVFRRCDLEAVFGAVAGDNEAALKFDRHLGFKEVYRLPNGWDHGIDLVYLQMLRNTCPWFTRFDSRFAH
jgi:hypothetical protein